MDNILIKGVQNFMGKEIPVIEGGFGEGKRCLTDKTIAEIHNQPAREIRRRINDNIKRFKENVDFIDLKGVDESHTLINLGYAKQSITQAEHIYLLSERGYAKLIKIMDTDLAWDIHDKLMDEYFTMREIINSNEQLKAMALLRAVESNGEESALAIKQYTDIRIQEETRPLLDKIEEDKPKVTFADRVLKSKDNMLVRQVAKVVSDEGFTIGEKKLYNRLREWGYICKNSTEPTQVGMDRKYFVVKIGTVDTPYGMLQTKTTLVTPKGCVHIVERLLKELENN